MDHDDEIAANRANWDERVESHLVAYGTDAFVADPTEISDVVRHDLEQMREFLPGSSPAGLSLVHLQCHIGTDTLSWARLGAHVTGIDFSGEALRAARELATRAGLEARFIESDVDHAAEAVPEQFDIVYTSIGAIIWLPDLAQWARVVAALLKPGGLFYIRDGHPMLYALDYLRDDGELVVTNPYFGTGEALRDDDGTDYASEVRLKNNVTYEWQHPISEIIQSLLDAGLRITSFREGQVLPWVALPGMVPAPNGFALPEGRERLPLTFSVTATR